MKVICVNAKKCKEKMCLHQSIHEDDHDKFFDSGDVLVCSKEQHFCPIINSLTKCRRVK